MSLYGILKLCKKPLCWTGLGDFLEQKSWNGGYNIPLFISENWFIVWGVLHKAPTSIQRDNRQVHYYFDIHYPVVWVVVLNTSL